MPDSKNMGWIKRLECIVDRLYRENNNTELVKSKIEY